MLWPLTRHRHLANAQLAQRLIEVRKQNPESERWLMLVEAALLESDGDAPWAGAGFALSVDRQVRAPILDCCEIALQRRPLHRWVRRLSELAAVSLRIDPVALLEAAVCQDDTRIDAFAQARGGEAPVLRVLAQIAALPLLQTCGRALAAQLQPSWWEGYCPLCGAWPTLAEFRGLERKRWLRCGRCGTGWEVPWLRCPFCDETDHTNLGYLAPEEGETTRKVEVCDSCKGYVKAEPTVRNLAPWEILLDDLATVPLEVAALDRGYHRPERAGYPLTVKVVEARR